MNEINSSTPLTARNKTRLAMAAVLVLFFVGVAITSLGSLKEPESCPDCEEQEAAPSVLTGSLGIVAASDSATVKLKVAGLDNVETVNLLA